MSSSTNDLKQDHLLLRRLRDIAQTCSDRLYANYNIPFEDIQIISVVIEEFVDRFHHRKEEEAYFPYTKDKDNCAEDVRKFLIEHELGRRIAKMLQNHITRWKEGIDSREPVARFLKSYSVFITDHTGKEDTFFDNISDMEIITQEDDSKLLKHYEICRKEAGGDVRIEQMIKLIEYLEDRNWMKNYSF